MDAPDTIRLYPNGATILNTNDTYVTYPSHSAASGETTLIDPTIDFFNNGDGSYYKFQYDNHTFSHWNTAADDSGTIYNIGDTTPQTNRFILYAIWEEDSTSSDLILTTTYGSITNNITSYGTFTLNTKGKFCQNDIVLSFSVTSELISLVIRYKGEIIYSTSSTEAITLAVSGKYLEDDIAVTLNPLFAEQNNNILNIYGAYTASKSGTVLTLT